MADDLTPEQQQAQDHPPSWSSVYGERNADLSVFQDVDPHPKEHSSAMHHARGRFQRDKEAQQARDLEVIERAAEEDADSQAYAEVMRLRNSRKPIPPALAKRAARRARAMGVAFSSAEQLAMRARR